MERSNGMRVACVMQKTYFQKNLTEIHERSASSKRSMNHFPYHNFFRQSFMSFCYSDSLSCLFPSKYPLHLNSCKAGKQSVLNLLTSVRSSLLNRPSFTVKPFKRKNRYFLSYLKQDFGITSIKHVYEVEFI